MAATLPDIAKCTRPRAITQAMFTITNYSNSQVSKNFSGRSNLHYKRSGVLTCEVYERVKNPLFKYIYCELELNK